jgi:hypothetical protein
VLGLGFLIGNMARTSSKVAMFEGPQNTDDHYASERE